MISEANGYPPDLSKRLQIEFEKFLYLHGVRRSQQTIMWFALEVASAETSSAWAASQEDVIAMLGGRSRDFYQEDMTQLLASPPS